MSKLMVQCSNDTKKKMSKLLSLTPIFFYFLLYMNVIITSIIARFSMVYGWKRHQIFVMNTNMVRFPVVNEWNNHQTFVINTNMANRHKI